MNRSNRRNTRRPCKMRNLAEIITMGDLSNILSELRATQHAISEEAERVSQIIAETEQLRAFLRRLTINRTKP